MIIPSYIKVLKNGSKYYSSFIGGRQHIYSFVNKEPLQKCREFISTYKMYHHKYPPADNSSLRLPTRPEDYDNLYTEVEETADLQRRCLMYNVGLVVVEKFDYKVRRDMFDVSLSVADILPEIDIEERVQLLNYALILNDNTPYSE